MATITVHVLKWEAHQRQPEWPSPSRVVSQCCHPKKALESVPESYPAPRMKIHTGNNLQEKERLCGKHNLLSAQTTHMHTLTPSSFLEEYNFYQHLKINALSQHPWTDPVMSMWHHCNQWMVRKHLLWGFRGNFSSLMKGKVLLCYPFPFDMRMGLLELQ